MTQDYSYLAKEEFKHACAFLDCANYFMTSTDRDDAFKRYYHHPVIVNVAFACEIFLKSILLSNGTVGRGHNLKVLIDILSEEDKSFLEEEMFHTYGGNIKTHGVKYLESVSNAFMDWRYSYEKEEISTNARYLMVLSEALKKLCLKHLRGMNKDG